MILNVNTINPTGDAYTAYINKNYLMPFEPNLFFAQFAQPALPQNGHTSVRWLVPSRMTVDPSQAEVTVPGITPNSTNFTISTIETSIKQYIIYSVLSDVLVDISEGYMLAKTVGELLGNNMSRIIDRVIQNEVLDNATNRTFAATTPLGTRAANRAAITANHNMFFEDFYTIARKLESRFAEYVDGSHYVAIMHTDISAGLRAAAPVSGSQTIFEASKYAAPDKIFKGEKFMINGIRVVETPFVKTYINASSVTVYPTVTIGKQAYGGASLQAMQNIVHGFESGGTADPANQRMTVASKVAFASKILRQESIEVFESAIKSGV